MKGLKRIFNDSKAASPVIGVMLMVVVTVILAAAVSAYSGGMMGSSEKAPSATFEVDVGKSIEDSMDKKNSHITIKHVTGDPIDTADLKIVTVNPNAAGDTKTRECVPGVNKQYNGEPYGDKNGSIPYWSNPSKGMFGDNPDVNFGNYTAKPGVIMAAQNWESQNGATWNVSAGDYDYNTGELGQMQDMFADWNNVSKDDFVTVKIVHTKSGKVIYSNDVMVR